MSQQYIDDITIKWWKGFEPWLMFGKAELWLAIILLILQQVVMGIPFIAYVSLETPWIDIIQWGIQILVALLGVGVAYFAYSSANRGQEGQLYSKIAKIDYRVIGILYLVLLVFQNGIGQFMNLPEQTNQVLIMQAIEEMPIVMGVSVTILAPIVEEVIFRELLPKSIGTSVVAYVIAGLIFTFIHNPVGFGGWVIYGTLSAVLVYCRIRRDNLNEAIILHMLNNSIAFILVLIELYKH